MSVEGRGSRVEGRGVRCEWCGTVLRTWAGVGRVWGQCPKCDMPPVLLEGAETEEKKGQERLAGAGRK